FIFFSSFILLSFFFTTEGNNFSHFSHLYCSVIIYYYCNFNILIFRLIFFSECFNILFSYARVLFYLYKYLILLLLVIKKNIVISGFLTVPYVKNPLILRKKPSYTTKKTLFYIKKPLILGERPFLRKKPSYTT